MTPKEKAEELCYKITLELPSKNGYLYAKQCALIAVNELIECTPSVDMYPPNFQSIHSRVREYWIKVKKEINLL